MIPFNVDVPEAVIANVWPKQDVRVVPLSILKLPAPVESLSALIVKPPVMLETLLLTVIPAAAERVIPAMWEITLSTVIVPAVEVIDIAPTPCPVILPKSVEVVMLPPDCRVRDPEGIVTYKLGLIVRTLAS